MELRFSQASGNTRGCPCCNSQPKLSAWGVVAPFLMDFVKPNCGPLVKLLECNTCLHRYYDYCFSTEEMTRLYGGYRSFDYFQCRNRVEPWYTKKVNRSNLNVGLISERSNSLIEFLEYNLASQNNDMIIADIGGDAGQFIPMKFASEAYVVEASSQPPVNGVTRVASLDSIEKDVDFVMVSHVLEHLPDPTKFLQGLLASPRVRRGCLVYLEVPLERLRISEMMRSIYYYEYLRRLVNLRFAVIVIDFCSILARSYLSFLMPPLIMKMHEHVNYFSMDSLRACATSAGLDVITVMDSTEASIATHQGVIRLLATKRF